MSLKQIYTWVAIGAGSLIVLGAGAANAATFTRTTFRPDDVLDFRTLGYTYNGISLPTGSPSDLNTRYSYTDYSTMTSSGGVNRITQFANAVRALKAEMNTTATGVQISTYDQFVATHLGAMDLAGRPGPNGQPLVNAAHGNAAFLPWHRTFIYEFEKQLQRVSGDTTLTIPYWNWTDANETTNMFTNAFMGSANTGNLGLQNGLFSGWQQRNDLSGNTWLGTATGTRSLVRRNNTNAQTAANNMQNVENNVLQPNLATATTFYLNTSNTGGINRTIEFNYHNPMHTWVAGSMNLMTSPNDPVFWMLHASVDRLWARWQTAPNAQAGANRLNGTAAYVTGTSQPYGHNRLDLMWPWDGGQSNVAADLANLLPTLPGVVAPNPMLSGMQFMMASAPSDLMSENTANIYNPWGHHAYHGGEPCPDILADLPCDKPCHNGSSVPEPASIFGLLTFGILGAGSLRKRKERNNLSRREPVFTK